MRLLVPELHYSLQMPTFTWIRRWTEEVRNNKAQLMHSGEVHESLQNLPAFTSI